MLYALSPLYYLKNRSKNYKKKPVSKEYVKNIQQRRKL